MAFARAIERAGRLIMAARRGLAAAHGLSVPAWRLLAVISRSQGRTSFALIARQLRISRQAVRDMAGDLRERGLLTRTQLLLTPKGHLSIAQLDEILRALLLEMTSDIPQDTLTAAAELLDGFSARLRRCESILGRRL